jgi:hypothetical protein
MAKKKILVDINDNAEDSGMDVDHEIDASDNDHAVTTQKENTAAPAKKKTASETYTKVTHLPLINFGFLYAYIIALPTRTYSETSRFLYRQC